MKTLESQAFTSVFEISADAIYATNDFGATYGLHRPSSSGRTLDGLPGFAQRSVVGSLDGRPLLTSTFIDAAFWSSSLREEGRVPESAFYHRGNVVVVPSFRTGGPLCPWCVALRLAAASAEPLIQRHFLSGGTVHASRTDAHPVAVHPAIVRRMQVSRSHLDRPDLYVSSHSLIGTSGSTRHHRVRPVPGIHGRHHLKDKFSKGCPTWHSIPPLESVAAQDLVDDLVGPIKGVLRDEDPSGLVTFVADTGYLGQFVKWMPDATGSGTGFSETAAYRAAVGEAVERYCGNYVAVERLVERSASDMRRDGNRVLTPNDFGSHYYCRTFPATFRPFDDDAPEYWLEATSLFDDASVWVPAEAAILNFTRRSGRRPQFPVPLTGIAAGATVSNAVHAALTEIVERDAVMRWWFGGTSASEIISIPADVEPIDRSSPGVTTWWLSLESDFGIPVVAGCLYDEENQVITAGFAARVTLAEAMSKAMFEAVQSRALILQFLDPGSSMRVAVDKGKLHWPVLGHDPHRNYRSNFRPDFSDMNQLLHNVQYYLDPSTVQEAYERLKPASSVDEYQELEATFTCQHDDLPQSLRQGGVRDLCAIDLTTDDFRSTHRVARVITPDLVGMVSTAHTPVWHHRLASLPELHVTPLPHS